MHGFEDLSDKDVDAFRSSMRTGRYNLLLGSGVSLDSRNALGILPSADGLRRDLCDATDANADTNLQRVFQLLRPDQVSTMVTSRYAACTAGPSVRMLTSFVWKRIFTFNIDDAVENAYATESTMQELKCLNYTDTYEETGPLTELQIVHLHGFSNREGDGYIFSTREYVQSMRDANAWTVVLAQHMPSEPFVLIGTSLNEPDLEYFLSTRSSHAPRSDRGPSILVSPNPDAATRFDCQRFGLTLFRGTCLDFFTYCRDTIPTVTPQQLIPAEQRRLLPSDVPENQKASFWADFDLVPSVVEPADPVTVPRFLYGHPPSWSDLAASLDVPRPASRDMTVAAQEVPKGGRARLLLLIDRPGTGKTTVLRRVAFELARNGRTVLNCTSLSRLQPVATVEALNLLVRPPVIVVDDFATQATQISSILGHADLRADVIVIGSERAYRERYIVEALSGIRFRRFSVGHTTSANVTQLVDTYFRFGVLGTGEALDGETDLFRQLRNDPVAVSCCRILNDFRPLDRIVRGIFGDSNGADQWRFMVAALAQFCFPAGVRYDVLTSIVGTRGMADQMRPDHALPLVYTTDSLACFVAPENATLGARVLVYCAENRSAKMLEAFVGLADGISARVNPRAIMRRSPEARLAGRLFDLDGPVRRLLGRDRARTFYERTRERWRWNSRYWGQCALLELEQFHADPDSSAGSEALDLAVQRARHAVALERHHFPLTTLGQALLTQMRVEGQARMRECFSEAFSILSEAIETERNRLRMAVQPYIILFRGTVEYVAAGGELSASRVARLQSLADEAEHRFGRDDRLLEVLDDLRANVDAVR